MLIALEPNARKLAEYMRGISEAGFYAGWMMDLEFDIWAAVIKGP